MRENISKTDSALVLIDDTELRSEVSTEFKKLYKAYARHLDEIDNHEKNVRPAYYRWFASLFGSRIDRLGQLQMELIKKSTLLERMRELCIFEGFSREDAVDQARDEFKDDDGSGSGSGSGFESEFGFETESRDESESESESEFEFDFKFETEFESKRSDEGNEVDLGLRRSEMADEFSVESKIKFYYRKLAQTLHPDLAQEVTDVSLEFWHETQDAYQSRDLKQLEMLWTIVSLQLNSLSREIRLFDLRAALAHLKQKLTKVKGDKRRLAREDISWKFDRKDKNALAAEINDEISRDEYELESALDDIEENLRLFSEPTDRQHARARKQRSRNRRMSFEL